MRPSWPHQTDPADYAINHIHTFCSVYAGERRWPGTALDAGAEKRDLETGF